MTVVFGSPRKIAWLLGIPLEELREAAADVERFYDPFDKKAQGKKTRYIDNPVGPLKKIQKRLNKRILAKQSFPAVMIGGIRKRDPLEHPRLHVGKRVVVTLDVKDCYPSITNNQVFQIWRHRVGCSPDVARLLTRLTTRLGHLPLGAATSTPLGNLVLELVVLEVEKLAKRHELAISQFIDDSALSGGSLSNSVITEVIQVFTRHGFRISRKKIRVMRSGRAQVVTRKNVNQKLALPVKKRQKVRAALHEFKTERADSASKDKSRRSLEGRIRDMSNLHTAQGEILQKDLQRVMAL